MNEQNNLTDIFACDVFNDDVMRARLPKSVYKSLRNTIDNGVALDQSIADVIASAMKDWALERGATHYCHWFHPMTGTSAEKHDSFIDPTGNGSVVTEFRGKELIQGEPDASSFPNGGLRDTFEARGYTAWDCTSPVFVKGDGDNRTMFIPTMFYSYTGETLDKKTPLLRSVDALSKQATRVLNALGETDVTKVSSTLGCEQEYFLVDRDFFEDRLDLVLCGRTLFGAPAPRGQEKSDHYFGALHERIASFMADLNQELWALGVTAKTQHNEVAPAQYEMAPVFELVNIAADHNVLVMEKLKKVAERHDFVCLLHEKPFAGINGSGKHHNWSMFTNTGVNLLDPGQNPHDNDVFLVFCAAVIKAVDEYAGLLRSSIATTGNDHRLGACEAPPAIISIFLGEQLDDIFQKLAKGTAKSSKKGGKISLSVSQLPSVAKDTTDRNRTSSFAFTGNRFEFRMPGSTVHAAAACIVMNTIVADILEDIAKQLEKSNNPKTELEGILTKIAKENMKVVFNGDGYDEEWVAIAEKRGLPHFPNAVSALAQLNCKKNKDVFKRQGVLSASELTARQEILLDGYSMDINIEARTAIQMVKRQILPTCLDYTGRLATAAATISDVGVDASAQMKALEEVNTLTAELQDRIAILEEVTDKADAISKTLKRAEAYRDEVFTACNSVREIVDSLEQIVDAEVWPLPTYAEMLFFK